MADLALHAAKTDGPGRCCLFEPEMQSSARRRKWINDELRQAVARGGEVTQVFQMQTDARLGHVAGFEALARWTHPTEGPIGPTEFVPAAEDCDLIEILTLEVLVASLRLAADIAARGFDGRIAVNMSPRLFDGRALELVALALKQTGAAPTSLEIEITGQLAVSRRDGIREEIEAIRALGVTVALDDFGMGYSSLSYLHRLPVDKIKIDRAFVTGMAASRPTRAIVRAIVELGHALGLTVTGEGAETEAERQSLIECGADVVQGWVDGQPIPADTVRRMPQAAWSEAPARISVA